MKAAGEVVSQALPPALTCFLRGLLTLPSSYEQKTAGDICASFGQAAWKGGCSHDWLPH
jgi:hypothetical protein